MSMSKAAFIEQLAKVLEVSPDTLKPDAALEEIEGWDSTAVINLIVLLDEMGVEVDESKIPDCKTVQDVMDLGGDAIE